MQFPKFFRALILGCALASVARAAGLSPLAGAGYSVLPAPQHVKLHGTEFRLGPQWRLQREGVGSDDVAVTALNDDLASRHGLVLADPSHDGPSIRLTLRAGAVAIDSAQDSDKTALASQAYRLEASPAGIHITANLTFALPAKNARPGGRFSAIPLRHRGSRLVERCGGDLPS